MLDTACDAMRHAHCLYDGAMRKTRFSDTCQRKVVELFDWGIRCAFLFWTPKWGPVPAVNRRGHYYHEVCKHRAIRRSLRKRRLAWLSVCVRHGLPSDIIMKLFEEHLY